jgi:uncharacterized protein
LPTGLLIVLAEINSELLIIALVAFGIGTGLGFLLAGFFSKPAKRQRHLSEQFRKSQLSAATYQGAVTEYFIKTSSLIKNLADCYADVHNHLVDSAAKLASLEASQKLADAGGVQLELIISDPAAIERAQAPRDYAPGHGVLSENYGFSKADPVAESDAGENDADSYKSPVLKTG